MLKANIVLFKMVKIARKHDLPDLMQARGNIHAINHQLYIH